MVCKRNVIDSKGYFGKRWFPEKIVDVENKGCEDAQRERGGVQVVRREKWKLGNGVVQWEGALMSE